MTQPSVVERVLPEPGLATPVSGPAADAAADGSAADQPVADQPAAVEPAAVEPAAVEPAAAEPVTAEPEPPTAVQARSTERQAVSDATAALLERLLHETDPGRRQHLVDEVVLINLPIARSLAMRYRERGVPTEDLVQVAALGLVKAVHGFDAERGRDFLAYAAPTMTGEIKRYFRDTGWAVRPPRRLQELRSRMAQVTQALSQDTGRAPTVKELAAALGVDQDEVVEAMVSGNGYATASLDAPPDGESGSWADTVADEDTTLSATPDRLALESMLARLPERERRILALRFFADKTQSEIGAEIGVTQMQVSRLLSRALRRLRDELESDDTGAGAAR